MMRRIMLGSELACGVLVALAACSPAPAPTSTATPVPPTSTVIPAGTPVPLAEIAQTVVIPAPGQLGYIDTSGTPPPLTPIVFTLDQIQFEVIDNSNGERSLIDIFADGSVTRDGSAYTADPAQVQALIDQLEAIRIYDVQGIFTGSNTSAGPVSYYLTVSGPLGSRSIATQDGFIPPELQAVFDAILAIVDSASPADA
jgi:hypothetical protein